MPFVAAKCPNCGGELQVDDGKRLAVCPYCKEPYMVEEAVNNYITNYNIENLHADNVSIIGGKTADHYAKSGDTNIRLGHYESAEADFENITNDYPYDYRGWWGLIRVKTREFSIDSIKWPALIELRGYYRNILTVGNYPAEIKKTYEQFDKQMTDKLKAASEIINSEAKKIEEKKEAALAALRESEKELELKQKNYNEIKERNSVIKNYSKKIMVTVLILSFMVLAYRSYLRSFSKFTNEFSLGVFLAKIIGWVILYVIIIAFVGTVKDEMYINGSSRSDTGKRDQKRKAEIDKLRNAYDDKVNNISEEYRSEMNDLEARDTLGVLNKTITPLNM